MRLMAEGFVYLEGGSSHGLRAKARRDWVIGPLA